MILEGRVKEDTQSNLSPCSLPPVSHCTRCELSHSPRDPKELSSPRTPKKGTSLTKEGLLGEGLSRHSNENLACVPEQQRATIQGGQGPRRHGGSHVLDSLVKKKLVSPVTEDN